MHVQSCCFTDQLFYVEGVDYYLGLLNCDWFNYASDQLKEQAKFQSI